MKAFGVSLVLLLAAAGVFAQSTKDQLGTINREIGDLSDHLNKQDVVLGQLTTLLQTTSGTAETSRTTLAIMADKQQGALKDLQTMVSAPVASLGTRLDQIAQSFQELKETILDMNSRLGKLDAKINDLQQQIQIGNHPAPPPQGGDGTSGPGGGMAAAPATGGGTCPDNMKAESTYANARRDNTSGNFDLAMQEFNDYVRCFPSTVFAPNAQFFIGDIYFRKGDYDNAVRAFENVIEQFQENNKTPDAHYMKGYSLLKLGQRDAAAKEFRLVMSKYADSDAAAQSKQRLKDLGLSSGSPAVRRRR